MAQKIHFAGRIKGKVDNNNPEEAQINRLKMNRLKMNGCRLELGAWRPSAGQHGSCLFTNKLRLSAEKNLSKLLFQQFILMTFPTVTLTSDSVFFIRLRLSWTLEVKHSHNKSYFVVLQN